MEGTRFDILMRRRQNNPILTGEAGVGKTAVVEGFALRIAGGDVPPALRNVALRALTGEEPAKNAGAPLRQFDESNIGSIDTKAAQQGAEWYDTEAATEQYKKLWGLE